MNKPQTAVPSLAGHVSRGKLNVALATLALAASAALAPVGAQAADVSHGKELADSHNCAACHGANLNKPVSPEYPKLAGQHADYIYWALRQYQMGNGNPHLGRNNPIMQAQVQSLSQSDMKDIAAYIESLKGDLIDKK